MKKTDDEEKGREYYIDAENNVKTNIRKDVSIYIDAEILSCFPIITTEKLFVSTLTYLQF